MNVDLYKSYLDLVVKINAFYYLVTGAILSFYFTNSTLPLVKWSLLFPLIMSLALSALFIIGASLAKVSRNDVFKIRDKLGLDVAPEIGVLILFLYTVAVFMLLVSIGLAFLIFCD
ncbi:MAG: hypothetical protein OQJ80_03020 [Kangiella sp.]|nr:hypothetical protein [Kangiella sp.]